MNKKIPDIDDLLDGINDTDFDSDALGNENSSDISTVKSIDASVDNSADNTEAEKDSSSLKESISSLNTATDSDCWNTFLGLTEESQKETDRDMRLVCKIDRELADTLDECDFNGLCRSDLVNLIVRAFVKTHLGCMAEYKKQKKSLFQKVGNK